MKKHKFKVNDNLIGTINTYAGFSPKDSLFELIDGSIDAEAKLVEVWYEDSEMFPGTKRIIVKDNGNGFENPKTGIPETITDFGALPENTSRTQHKAFGIGTRQALTSVANDGGYASVESSDGSTSARFKVLSDIKKGEWYMVETEDVSLNKRGTIIILDGVKTKDSVNTIYGEISVTYYPMSKKAIGQPGLAIKFNDKEVRFHDPLMRDLIESVNDDSIAKLTTETVKNSYGEYKLSTATFIHSGDVKKFHDHPVVADYFSKTPYEKNDGLKSTASGRYILRNGRYISLGNGKHGLTEKGNVRSNGHNLYGTRTEIVNVNPTDKSNNSTEFSTMNKSNDQTEALYGNPDHAELWSTETQLVTSSENHFKKITGEDGHKPQQIDVIEGIVNTMIGNYYNNHDSYVSLSESDSSEVLVPTSNGEVTRNGKKKVNWVIPKSLRESCKDTVLKTRLTDSTIDLHNYQES